MKWFKKPQDLYDLLLLENLWFGNAGSFARRVPGGWIFYDSTAREGVTGRSITGTFVPYNDEFKNLSDENIRNLADHPESMDTEDLAEKENSASGKIGHQPGPG